MFSSGDEWWSSDKSPVSAMRFARRGDLVTYPEDIIEMVARIACDPDNDMPMELSLLAVKVKQQFAEIPNDVEPSDIALEIKTSAGKRVPVPGAAPIEIYTANQVPPRNSIKVALTPQNPPTCSRLDIIFPHAPAGLEMAATTDRVAAPKHAAAPRHIDLPRTIRQPMRDALTNRPLFVTELVDKIIASNNLPAITIKHRFDVANQIAKTIDGIEFVFVLEGPDSNKVKYIPK